MIGLAASAQQTTVFAETFENVSVDEQGISLTLPTGWTNYGDNLENNSRYSSSVLGKSWFVAQNFFNSGKCAGSISWTDQATPCDRWLVTPSITLPQGRNTLLFTFYGSQYNERFVVLVSTATCQGINALRKAIAQTAQSHDDERSITGEHVQPGDSVLLVMPQDRQAPKGRLILPQVQTIRDLLDNGCTITCCTPDQMEHSLAALCEPPALIITDSQVFEQVHRLKPAHSRLTSFSILMAAWKGDLDAMIDGARAIDRLTPQSRVLIAEACAHAPLTEDIGREKIPALLRKRVGPSLQVDVVAGRDFPVDLRSYDLVIHCGACMFNRRYMLSRIRQAQAQGVPITNYGVAIAHLKGILQSIHNS